MPIYCFKNILTEEVRDDQMMSISAMESFLAENPDWKIQITSAPAIGDTVRLGLKKTPASFRDLLGHIKKGNRRSTIRSD